jgi:hypothetical protein
VCSGHGERRFPNFDFLIRCATDETGVSLPEQAAIRAQLIEMRRLQKENKPIEHRPPTLRTARNQLAVLSGYGEDWKELEIFFDIGRHTIDP